jgi:hypothetical protein
MIREESVEEEALFVVGAAECSPAASLLRDAGQPAIVRLHQAIGKIAGRKAEDRVAQRVGSIAEGLRDDAEVVHAEIELEADAEEFVVAHPGVFVPIDGIEPSVDGLVEIGVVGIDERGDGLAGEGSTNEFNGAGGGVAEPVHPRAVEWIDEPRRITGEDDAIARDGVAGISQLGAPFHIAIDGGGIAEDFCRGGMGAEERFESVAERGGTFRPLDAALVEHDADGGVAAAEGNEPCPPTIAHDVIGGGVPDAMAGGSPFGKAPGEVQVVPVLDAAPTGPASGGGVVGVGAEPTLLAGDERGEAARVDDPAGGECFGAACGFDGDALSSAWGELDVAGFGGAEEVGTGDNGAAKDFLIEGAAIDLPGGDAGEVTSADFGTLGQRPRLRRGEPEAHALLGELGFVEEPGEAKDAAEEVAADLDGGLAHAPGEVGGLLDDPDAERGVVAEKQERRGGTREGATEDQDVEGCGRRHVGGSLKISDSSLKPGCGGLAGARLDTASACDGVATSSSPWEWLWNGDEDVATPFLTGAVSRCALAAGPSFRVPRREAGP